MKAADKLSEPGFGNVMLNGLHEIELPEPPSYRPQTIGWAILLAIALVAIVILGSLCYRNWQANRYRREALHRLAELEQAAMKIETRSSALVELPLLLRQTALSAFPREEIVQLSGESWLKFLDQSYGGSAFTQGTGQLIAQLAYQPPLALDRIPNETVINLIGLVRTWIERI